MEDGGRRRGTHEDRAVTGSASYGQPEKRAFFGLTVNVRVNEKFIYQASDESTAI